MKQLDKMKDLKYVETLSVIFEKYTGDSIIIKTVFFNSKTKTVINTKDIDEDLLISSQEIQNKIVTWISEGSGWTIKSVIIQTFFNTTLWKDHRPANYLLNWGILLKDWQTFKIMTMNISDGVMSDI